MEEETDNDHELAHRQTNLLQRFSGLEQYWDSINKRSRAERRCCSTGSSYKITKRLEVLVNIPPQQLMSSLQHDVRASPELGREVWRVRNNELAVEEILADRRAAIESGKLKGRRLFEEVDDDEIGLVHQESEVRSVFSYEDDEEDWGRKGAVLVSPPPSCPRCHCSYPSSSSSSSSSLCGDQNVEAEKRSIDDSDIIVVSGGRRRRRSRWIVFMVWLAFALLVCMACIISVGSLCQYEDIDEELGILTPT